MRYYIIDNMGNIWGDFQNFEKAKIILENYSEKEKKENDLEIIKSNN